MVDVSQLTKAELAEFAEWVREKRDRFQDLLDGVNARLSSGGKSPERPIAMTVSANGDERGKRVLSVMTNSGKWLANSDLRAQYQKQFSEELDPRFLIRFLRKHENADVRRQGSGRYTKWRAIEKK